MRLLLSIRGASRVCDWSGYAVLRDNVQHFIEGGQPSERFAALHSLEAAVDSGRAVVDAAKLRGEVMRAWYGLAQKTAQQAALSLRTRAIMTGASSTPSRRGTVVAGCVGWRLPLRVPAESPLRQGSGDFVAAVLELTSAVVDGELIEVRREGNAPRYVREFERPSVRLHARE